MKAIKTILLFFLLILVGASALWAQGGSKDVGQDRRAEEFRPDTTLMFAQRDTCKLFLDLYQPAVGSSTTLETGEAKPTVVFVFGGGFVQGRRNARVYRPWFKLLTDNGYRVVSVDYRLGLKGVDMSFSIFHIFSTARHTRRAVEMGVEDVFSALGFLIEKGGEFGIDSDNLVLSGSSAGAMISLAAEQEISNRSSLASVLPADFNLRGVMSFAGAIVSDTGKPKYEVRPCPQLLFHGTADKTVNYNKLHIFRYGIFGTNWLARLFKKRGYEYNIYRFRDHGHDIAENFLPTWPEQKRFLETNVARHIPRLVDSSIDDPLVPKWHAATLDSLY